MDLFRHWYLLFSIRLWICSDTGICCFLLDYGSVPTLVFVVFYYNLDLFRHWYLLFSIRLWICSDTGICYFLLDYGSVPTLVFVVFY